MKRVVLYCLIFGLVLTGLTWAGGQAEPGEEKKEIEVWLRKSFSPDSDAELEARIREFAEMKNAVAKIEFLSVSEQYTKMNAAIEADEHPDIAFFPYNGIAEYYDVGVLRDLSGLIGEIQTENGPMNKKVLQSVTQEGKQYGIPLGVTAHMLFYRKDLLQKAGISQPPKTWKELEQVAIATNDPKNGIYGFGLGSGKNNSDFEWIMRCIIWSFGGSLFGETDAVVTVNSPEVRAAFQYVVDLFEKYKVVPPSAKNWDDGSNNTSFQTGQTAMTINTPSIYRALVNDDSDLLPLTGISMLPVGPNGQFITGSVRTLAIMTGSEEPELSEELLKYLLSADWYSNWLNTTIPLYVPVYDEMVDISAWQTEFNKPFADSVKAFSFIGYPGYTTTKVSIPFNSRYLNATLQRIITDGMSVADSVKQLERDLKALK